ncbi:MFS transporter [Vulcaniibacterium tengchongense]|uniref:Sugar transport protein n=1 Tax=Vulcaniibacterium tengchongense TaxID=1273429 RepID=A0A3N4VAS8_9GAMM|nr:MFS transporter [Vulcaniibacterium tengchongense]RPE79688.1 sugar transport protein [Vulcaniibacterium tengchongense]
MNDAIAAPSASTAAHAPRWRLRYLLFIAGMGGLLYGIDIGIIAGALPYLEATATQAWHLTSQQLGFVVAAVLFGSVLSSLFAGAVADLIGRRGAMALAGALFAVSIPVMALASGYLPLLVGRLLQGVSGGLIGVVVPLYLAEVLSPDRRGRGAAMFQLLLTVGLVLAAVIGLYHAHAVDAAAAAAQALDGAEQRRALFEARDHAWRTIFWSCLLPGLVFTGGVLLLSESPRWLVRRGRIAEAREALRRTVPPAQVEATLRLMQAPAGTSAGAGEARDRLLSRRYLLPFLLACLILACTQATGINSVLAYSVNILHHAGLPGAVANWADVAIKLLNAAMTLVALALVDRKGRKFLLMLGSGGIAVALLAAALLFLQAERGRLDVRDALQRQATGDALSLRLDAAQWRRLGAENADQPLQLAVSYSYGGFSNVRSLRSDAAGEIELALRREDAVRPDGAIGAFFRRLHLNPFPDPAAAAQAPLRIERARLGPVPPPAHGWAVAACILVFVAFFAVGPGVCVWLALSELMPTRIRSNGMSIALLINQFVSTVIAAIFLPTVGHYGYASMFLFWAGCTVVFFVVAAVYLPETKGKSLEQIEAHFR